MPTLVLNTVYLRGILLHYFVERRFVMCELLLQRQKRKYFLHRIVTDDEKWIRYDNPKRRKSWGKPDHASTSSAKTKYSWFEASSLYQQGVIDYELLKTD